MYLDNYQLEKSSWTSHKALVIIVELTHFRLLCLKEAYDRIKNYNQKNFISKNPEKIFKNQ